MASSRTEAYSQSRCHMALGGLSPQELLVALLDEQPAETEHLGSPAGADSRLLAPCIGGLEAPGAAR